MAQVREPRTAWAVQVVLPGLGRARAATVAHQLRNSSQTPRQLKDVTAAPIPPVHDVIEVMADRPGSRHRLITTALRRGLLKRCPHCGQGPLFARWHHLDRCSVCGLVYERNPGDTWAFTVVGDRLPVAAIIVLLYVGLGRSHRVLGLTMFVVMGGLLVLTAPNRWGVGIALHYLSRVFSPDPEDPIPEPRP